MIKVRETYERHREEHLLRMKMLAYAKRKMLKTGRRIPMKRFKPALKDRFFNHYWRLIVIWTVAALALIVIIALQVYLSDKNAEIKTAQAKIAKAESDREEVLQVLAGKLVMVEPIGDGYAKYATVSFGEARKVGTYSTPVSE